MLVINFFNFASCESLIPDLIMRTAIGSYLITNEVITGQLPSINNKGIFSLFSFLSWLNHHAGFECKKYTEHNSKG